MSVARAKLTAEEFWALHLERAELVNGEVVELVPALPQHGQIPGALVTALNLWLKQSKAGLAGTDGGFILGRNPDRVRGPDVWFLRKENIPAEFPAGFWEVAPDLVAEIVSTSDTAEVIKEKLTDYFAAGTQVVWLVYPRFKEVEVHTSSRTVRILQAEDVLQEPELLPGFTLKIAKLFEGPV